MKTNKKQGLLYIFNILKDGGYVSKKDIMNELCISENSFWKYFQELRAFISNFYLPYEIKYSRAKQAYCMEEFKNEKRFD